jgi:hypothetical protein
MMYLIFNQGSGVRSDYFMLNIRGRGGVRE